MGSIEIKVVPQPLRTASALQLASSAPAEKHALEAIGTVRAPEWVSQTGCLPT